MADVVAADCWAELKISYRKCLLDSRPAVVSLALRFHAKLLLSGSHFAVKEGESHYGER